MAEPNARDTKLIQYLNEAYGKEKELEMALTAHIGLTSRAPYKKRLREHLKETKAHGRAVGKRIRELGGKPETVVLPEAAPDGLTAAAAKVQEVASKGIAAAKGPLHAIRGTGENERMLKNAKTEYSEEFEEIATYTAIETLAEAVGDKDTAKLARSIRREEERMAKFLERQIPALTKAVVQEEIPASERRTQRASSSRRATASRSNGASASRASRSRTTSKGSRSNGGSAPKRKTAARSAAGSRTRSRARRSGS
jgi:ferritin-like metal-binding protein YciE